MSIRKTRLYAILRMVKHTKKTLRDFGLERLSINEKLHTFGRILFANRHYGWDADEYFLYHFEDLTHEQRLSFICESEHFRMANALNGSEGSAILADKWLTYQKFQPFFKRKAFCYMPNAEMGGG